MSGTCETCRFCRYGGENAEGQTLYFCHGAPPSVFRAENGGLTSQFPVVVLQFWCGSYRRRWFGKVRVE